MFLKSLKITNGSEVIRDIPFHKGINLIIDETKTEDKRDSGNSVGKTTVLRLIDFCLGGSGKNIYQDTEFKNTNNVRVEEFLKQNDLIITLILKEDLEDIDSNEIEISRNFLARGEKIQKINNESYNNPKEFEQKLKALIFGSTADKPTFRQIIAKNIRDEKNRLANTVKILHPTTTPEEYEALYLFWLGIDSDSADRKHRLSLDRKIEENHQRKLRTEWTLPQLTHFLLVVNSRINELEVKKANFNLNDNFNEELSALNQTKSELNQLSSEVSRLEIRRELILESKEYLEKDLAEIDTQRIKKLYNEAKALVPSLQKSFEETLSFHNQMISEKVKYITEELPALETELSSIKL